MALSNQIEVAVTAVDGSYRLSGTGIVFVSVPDGKRGGGTFLTRPAFVLVSGDLVQDAVRVSEEEAHGCCDLYTKATAAFPCRFGACPAITRTPPSAEITVVVP